MIKRNVWKEIISPCELHEDSRGRIADIFYKEEINHVAIIDSKVNVIRGNHYHKLTTQHVLLTKGSLEYWYKPSDTDNAAKSIILVEGDLITTPPLEVHALKTLTDTNQFIVFSEGIRGGKDYEGDTYRITPSIIPNN